MARGHPTTGRNTLCTDAEAVLVGVDIPAGALGLVAEFDRRAVAGIDMRGGFRLAAGAGSEGGKGGDGEEGEEGFLHGAHRSGETRRVEANPRREASGRDVREKAAPVSQGGLLILSQ